MKISGRKIIVDKDTAVTSEWAVPANYDRNHAVVIAHGAGNDMHSPLLSHLHKSIANQGILCVKFNFPYKEQGRRIPDRPDRLMSTWRAVIATLTADLDLSPNRVVLSGKSLGGRMASMVAAEDRVADGLVFFGYPLHPPGQTDKLRITHLENIVCPMLFVQGTRDPLCDLELLKTFVLDPSPKQTTLHVVESGDHSFNVLKKTQRTAESVWQEIVTVTINWLENI